MKEQQMYADIEKTLKTVRQNRENRKRNTEFTRKLESKNKRTTSHDGIVISLFKALFLN